MAKMFQKFEFPAWSCQIFTIEIKIPENQIRHHFRIHLGNPLCILLLIILELTQDKTRLVMKFMNIRQTNFKSLGGVCEKVRALQPQREDGVEEGAPLLPPVVLHDGLQQLQRLAVLLRALQLLRHRHCQVRLAPGRAEGSAKIQCA